MVANTKIMVLEDEALIGLDLCMTLEEHGFEVLGPYTTVEKALHAFEKEAPSVGILDVNLSDGKTSFALAERFREAGLPFVFLTGYDVAGNPTLEAHRKAKRISKPFQTKAVLDAITEAIG